MRSFLDQDFLLQSKTAERLYHDYAADLPIIDYHCHLSPEEITEDKTFENLSQAWLKGDHYKWRAMRANGVPEKYCTGNAPDEDKFKKWSETVPYTMRNPLYHWTHLELRRYFGITDLLNPETAENIYREANSQLVNLSTNEILDKMKVEVVCTTDDPTDSLEFHKRWQLAGNEMVLAPTFRADKVLAVADPKQWNEYVDQLATVSGIAIESFTELMTALGLRHDFFHSMGCRLSDCGLEIPYADKFSSSGVEASFRSLRSGAQLGKAQVGEYYSAVLLELARMHHAKGWVQQYHLGALRNNNSRMLQRGPDTGHDSIGDLPLARQLSRFFDQLDCTDQLAKTIIYNLNPSDNAVFATMAGNFNDGETIGKMQFGSGWWFLDQKDGIEQQLNTLSNMGLLSRFVGMLTDSRSFLSFPRHEYFRRILCNLLGADVEKGELPNDLKWLGKMVRDISYHNAKEYFQFFNIKTNTTVL